MPVNESNTIQYMVTTTRITDGTVLYWKTTGNTTNSDIVGGNTGTITVTNNRAYINVTLAADETPDGTKTLGITLLTGSLNGTAVATTDPNTPIVINDTSTAPTIFPTRLYSWGRGGAGRLGLNDTVHRSSPTQVGTNTNWSSISPTENNAAAIKTDGTLWMWGENSNGQLGLNNTIYRSSPTQIGTDTNWSSVSCGGPVTLAKKTNGTLWVWGTATFGANGLNSAGNKSSPTQVGTGTDWDKVAGGHYFCFATKTDGTLWAWGRNHAGNLGNNQQNINISSPVQIGTGTNWNLIKPAGSHTMATKTDGTLWLWGNNTYGELGVNNRISRSSPTQVGAETNWNELSSGGNHTLATKTNGTLWAFGRNQYGELGQNDIVYRSSPTQVGTATNWNKIGSGIAYHIISSKTDGTLWLWGLNGYGELGSNDRVNRSSPVQIGSATNWSVIAAGERHSFAITSN